MATVANVLHILLQFPFSSLGNLGKTKFVLLMKRMMHTAGKPECLIAKCKKGKPTYEIGIVHCNLKLQQVQKMYLKQVLWTGLVIERTLQRGTDTAGYSTYRCQVPPDNFLLKLLDFVRRISS